MGHLFRCEDMQLMQLIMQREAVHDIIEELGRIKSVEFVDLNEGTSGFQRKFANEVKRASEMERRLRFFEKEIAAEGLVVDDTPLPMYSGGYRVSEVNSTARMDDLDERLIELEEELVRMNSHKDTLERSAVQLVEIQHMIESSADFFDNAEGDFNQAAGVGAHTQESIPILGPAPVDDPFDDRAVKLGFVTGLINRDVLDVFERVLWRTTKGNVLVRQTELAEKLTNTAGEEVDKNVFVIFFQGDRLKATILKICESLSANVYPCPDSYEARTRLLDEVTERSRELDTVMFRTNEQRRQVLRDLAERLPEWFTTVRSELAIYEIMNRCKADVSHKTLVAEVWAPTWATQDIQDALDRGTDRASAPVRSVFSVRTTSRTPPTYHMTGKYTKGFQMIVDSFGMARYKEVNPGPFTVITFPFLFGIMFGDVGHGGILLGFGLLLIALEKKFINKKNGEMFGAMFGGRYMLASMGFFAFYAGLLYNDCFALSLNLFGSNFSDNAEGEARLLNVDRVYPVGLDPGWSGAVNKLSFYNSFKMKMSIIVGVSHMLFGVVLSLFNNIQFGNTRDIFCTTIPQILFLLALFGYLCMLIIIKWTTYWGHGAATGQTPPMLITTLIAMFLQIGAPVAKEEQLYAFGTNLQGNIQVFLVLLLVICVPWMLFLKLYLEWRDRKNAPPTVYHNVDNDHDGDVAAPIGGVHEDEDEGHGGGDHEHEDFSEIVVHQVIHTIEYVLGTVSNTASYLRLWALSLAHAQLAEVFWNELLYGQITNASPIGIYITFFMWCMATIGVLLVMECLSAFLHALRLHWVEFQNKFYVGDGYAFVPFDLEKLASKDSADE